MCQCEGCSDYRDYDEIFKSFCLGLNKMVANGIVVSAFSGCSVLAGSLAVLMPLYHTKKSKIKCCKRTVKSGCCLHVQFSCQLLSFIVFCSLVFSLKKTMDLSRIELHLGAKFLFSSFGVCLVAYLFFICKYRKDLSLTRV